MRKALVLSFALLALAGARTVAAQICGPELDDYARTTCELAATGVAPLCDPIDVALQSTVDRSLGRAERFVQAADATARAKAVEKFLRRADRALGKIQKRAARLEARGRISSGCRAAVDQRISALRGLVASLASGTPSAPPGLPDFVAGYTLWLRLNAEPIPPRPGSDAHFGTKNVFVNQARETLAPDGTQGFPYPDGTIIVKESTRPGADFVGLIATMRKQAGSDPAHGDWTFVEYSRSSATQPFSLLARDGACFGCHQIAETTDWVYTLLE